MATHPLLFFALDCLQYHSVYQTIYSNVRYIFQERSHAPTPTYYHFTMADASAQPKPSSSVKLVLLGEAAVGKVYTMFERKG